MTSVEFIGLSVDEIVGKFYDYDHDDSDRQLAHQLFRCVVMNSITAEGLSYQGIRSSFSTPEIFQEVMHRSPEGQELLKKLDDHGMTQFILADVAAVMKEFEELNP